MSIYKHNQMNDKERLSFFHQRVEKYRTFLKFKDKKEPLQLRGLLFSVRNTESIPVYYTVKKSPVPIGGFVVQVAIPVGSHCCEISQLHV